MDRHTGRLSPTYTQKKNLENHSKIRKTQFNNTQSRVNRQLLSARKYTTSRARTSVASKEEKIPSKH